MNTDKMRAVAWIGERFVRGAISGLIVDFHGLGAPGMKSVPAYEEQEWAEAGGLVVTPYSDAQIVAEIVALQNQWFAHQ